MHRRHSLRSASYRNIKRRRLGLEALERRNLLATFTVSILNDELDGNLSVDDLSLREAITLANSAPGDDIVQLPAGTYTLTIAGPDENASATGDLDVTENLSIVGLTGNRDNVVIDGGSLDRVFDVFDLIGNPILFELQDLTVRNGLVGGTSALGGGIFVSGNLSLNNVVVRDNQVIEAGGEANGGGIFVDASNTLDITNSLITNNTAGREGGGMYVASAAITISGTTISNNNAGLDGGGALILNQRPTTIDISGSTFATNKSGTSSVIGVGTGGAISIAADINSVNPLVAAETTISNTSFTGNTAFDSGGAIYAVDSNFALTGATFLNNISSDAGGGAIFESSGTGGLSLTGSVNGGTFQGNQSFLGGGGLLIRDTAAIVQNLSFTSNIVNGNGTNFGEGGGALTFTNNTGNQLTAQVNNVLFDNNQAPSAGAIAFVDYLGTVTNSTITNNQATSNGAAGGGGIGVVGEPSIDTPSLFLDQSTVNGNSTIGVGGGGIGLLNASAQIRNTDISNNTAVNPNGNGPNTGLGGGIGSLGDSIARQSIKIEQSTIAANRAFTGGGIFVRDNVLAMENSTLSGNTTTGNGDAIVNDGAGTAALTHVTIVNTNNPTTIISPRSAVINNSTGTFDILSTIIESTVSGIRNGLGPFNSQGFNLDSDGTLNLNAASDQNLVSANLLPLANNGGRTRTHALGSGSRAIDRADPGSLIVIDQRNVSRPIDGDGNGSTVNDVGAFEATQQVATDLAVSLTAPPTAVPGTGQTYTIVVTNNGPSNATGVRVINVLPTGLSFASGTGSGVTFSENAGTVTATIGNLASGASITFTLNVNVASSLIGSVINTVSVSGGQVDGTPGNDSDSVTTALTPRYDLILVKSDSPDPATPGGQLTYSFTVANAGPSDAQNVVVNDTLPAGLTFVSGFASPGSVVANGNDVTISFASISASGSQAGSVVTAIGPGVRGTIDNTADVRADNFDSQDVNLNNNSVTSNTTLVPSVDVSLSVVDTPDPVNRGGTLTYNVTVNNSGPSTATVSYSANLPAGVTFSGGTAPGPVGVVSPSGSSTFQFTVLVDSGLALNITSLATTISLTTTESDSNSANNSVTVTTNVGQSPTTPDNVTTNEDTSVTIDVLANDSGTFSILDSIRTAPTLGTATISGSQVIYTPQQDANGNDLFTYIARNTLGQTVEETVFITITPINDPPIAGDDNLGNVVAGATRTISSATLLSNDLAGPANERLIQTLRIINVSGNSLRGGSVSLLSNPSPNDTVSYIAPSGFSGTDSFTYTLSDGSGGIATATVTVNVVNDAVDLSATITDTPDPVAVDGNLTYSITITNSSSTTATNVSALVELDLDLSFVSGSGTGFTFFPNQTVTASLDSLPGGESRTFTLVLFVSSSATGPLISNLSLFSDQADSNPANDTASVSTTVAGSAPSTDVSIVQSTSDPFVTPGQSLTYTLAVRNNGSTTATGVVADFIGSTDLTINSVSLSTGGAITAPATSFLIPIGNLAPSQTVLVTIVTTVSPTTSNAVINSALVSITGVESDLSNNSTGASLPLELSLGRGTRGIVAVNLDGDSHPDLAVINEFSNDLVLLENNGVGFFDIQERITLAGRPRSIVSKANASGGSIIAIADAGVGRGPGALFVYENQSLSRFTVGNGPLDVAISDFNKDGVFDYAVPSLRSGDLQVLLGGQSTPKFVASTRNPIAVDVSDFNLDGNPDILLASGGYNEDTEGSLTLYLGDGNGGFTPLALLVTIKGVVDLGVVNLDGVGADEVISITSSGNILVYTYTPGAELPFVLRQSITTDPDLSSLEFADVNGDQRLDVLVTNLSDDSLNVYITNASGQISLAATTSGVSAPSDVAVADFDGDLNIEMITTSYVQRGNTSTPSYSYSSLATQVELNRQSATPTLSSRRLSTPALGNRPLELEVFIDPVQLGRATTASSEFDINRDSRITPLDALLVINTVQRSVFGAAGEFGADTSDEGFNYDVNGDGSVTPLDALLIINELNRSPLVQPESESRITLKKREEKRNEWVDQYFANL